MRIGLDVTPLAGSLTGIGNFVEQLVHGIHADDRFELGPIALSGRSAATIRDRMPEGVDLAQSIPASVVHRLWRHIDIPTARQLARQPIDLVHGTNFYGLPGAGQPELITIHDTGPWHRPNDVPAAARAFPGLVDRALKRGAHVHTLSHAAGDEIATLLKIPAERLHPIQIGFDTPSATTRTPLACAHLSDARFILALGAVEPRKRLPELVDAVVPLLKSDPQLHLVIAGGGPEAESLRNKIAALGAVNSQVVATGYVNRAEKSWLLRSAAVVVSNSLAEGFGMVPLEAMSVGTPVVSTDGDAQREVCGNAALLVPVNDSLALTEAVRSVLADSSAAGRLTSYGREQASLFSWPAMVRQMLALYEQLAHR